MVLRGTAECTSVVLQQNELQQDTGTPGNHEGKPLTTAKVNDCLLPLGSTLKAREDTFKFLTGNNF